MKKCQLCKKDYEKRNKKYCCLDCKFSAQRKEVLATKDWQTHSMYEVVIKDVLPTAKDIKELNKWCSVASDRAKSDEVNPYL